MNNTILDRPVPPAPTQNSPRFLLFLICLFASAGQIAIDIYVPALPAMARFFATSPQAIQSSVSGYMAAYALGQLVFGPIADAYGRKRVLAFGLVIFTIGSLRRIWRRSSSPVACRDSASPPRTCSPRRSSPTHSPGRR